MQHKIFKLKFENFKFERRLQQLITLQRRDSIFQLKFEFIHNLKQRFNKKRNFELKSLLLQKEREEKAEKKKRMRGRRI